MKSYNVKLNWSRKFFTNFPKKKKLIGYNISSIYKSKGRVFLIDGLCIERRGKNFGIINSSITVRKKIGSAYLTTKFFLYFGCFCKYKIISYTFKKKKINFAKISKVRLA